MENIEKNLSDAGFVENYIIYNPMGLPCYKKRNMIIAPFDFMTLLPMKGKKMLMWFGFGMYNISSFTDEFIRSKYFIAEIYRIEKNNIDKIRQKRILIGY